MFNSQRVIALVDLDCFYCQVEEQLNPSLKGKPLAVLQYNVWREGGIIAANYAARKFGINKGMWRSEAEAKCPNIEFARVPELRGKADLTRYREAGLKVADVLQTFTPLLERASIDEAYVDITDIVEKHLNSNCDKILTKDVSNTFVVGDETEHFLNDIYDNSQFCEGDIRLAVGAVIVEKMRAKVFTETGYETSAGIAHNKLLAKMVSSLHKPNKQTILTQNGVQNFLQNLPIKKMKNLGGKFGSNLAEKLGITVIGHLLKYKEKDLMEKFDEKTGKWLYNIARGIDTAPVTPHFLPKSLACSKRFPGKYALREFDKVQHWVNEIAIDLTERFEKDISENNRRAKQMTISVSNEVKKTTISHSKTLPLIYDAKTIGQKAFDVVKGFLAKNNEDCCVTLLSISVSNFEDIKNTKNLQYFFKNVPSRREPNTSETHFTKRDDKIEQFNPDASSFKNSNFDKLSCEKITDDFATHSVESLQTNAEMELCAENSNTINAENGRKNTESKNYSFFKSYFESNDNRSSNLLEFHDESTYKGINEEESGTPESNHSFFKAYFEKLERQKIEEANKVTSTHQPENTVPDKFFEENSPNNVGCNRTEKPVENEAVNNPYVVFVTQDIPDKKVSCLQCNKVILEKDYDSHMDYHFAWQLRKEESTINKVVVGKANKKIDTVKKSPEKSKSIDSFLVKVLPKEESELCPQCSKRVHHADLESHLDYHAAKKLHLEINSPIKNSKTVDKILIKNSKKDKKPITVRSISSFFKQH